MTESITAASGLTVSQIIRATPADRIQNSNNVKLTAVKVGTSKKSGLRKIIGQSVSVDKSTSKRSKYTTSLEILSDKTKKVRVSCSCDDFMYRWEFALAKRGAAEIMYGNGEPPIDRNPGLKPGACKHVIRIVTEASDRGLL